MTRYGDEIFPCGYAEVDLRRYEHRRELLTSNLVFSKWEKIFKDPMTTAAAIDRLVHHKHHLGAESSQLTH